MKEETKCLHKWDKVTGIKILGRPHIGIKSRYVRTCENCGKKESYSSGMFTGWFTETDPFYTKK